MRQWHGKYLKEEKSSSEMQKSNESGVGDGG